MKISFWDVLTVMGLIVLCIVAALIAWLFVNPNAAINPFPPPTCTANDQSIDLYGDITAFTCNLDRCPGTQVAYTRTGDADATADQYLLHLTYLHGILDAIPDAYHHQHTLTG